MNENFNISSYNGATFSQEQVALENQRFMVKVYQWMTLALAITGLVAYGIAASESLISFIAGHMAVYYVILIVELIVVFTLAARIDKMSLQSASILFILYSLLNGISLAPIFLVYELGSIASTFFITAGTFLTMSLYGYFTKKDLTKWGNLLFMLLIGLVFATIINLFFQNEVFYWITTYAGIFIFVGLIAYDTQKLKEMNIIGNEGTDTDRKEAIVGALTLYLDFINLFLYLLRIFGKRN